MDGLCRNDAWAFEPPLSSLPIPGDILTYYRLCSLYCTHPIPNFNTKNRCEAETRFPDCDGGRDFGLMPPSVSARSLPTSATPIGPTTSGGAASGPALGRAALSKARSSAFDTRARGSTNVMPLSNCWCKSVSASWLFCCTCERVLAWPWSQDP